MLRDLRLRFRRFSFGLPTQGARQPCGVITWRIVHVWMLNGHMNAGDWIVVGIFAVAGVSVALMTAAAIVLLRTLHLEFASTRLHIFVRRYGLWDVWSHMLRSVRSRNLCLHWSRYAPLLGDARWGGGAAACGAIAGMLLPAIVLLPLILQSSRPSLLDDALELTAGIAAILGAILGIGFWLRGLSYMARPQDNHIGVLPRISSKDLSLDVRNNLALNIFWYSQLWWIGIVGAAYPWLFAIVMSYTIDSSSPAKSTVTAQSSSSLIGIAVIAATVIPPFMIL